MSRHPEGRNPFPSQDAFDGWGRDRLLLTAVIFLVALAVRLLHVWSLRDAPFFGLQMGDAATFHEWASRLAGGDWLGSDVFLHAPLYPYFLGVVYAVLGSDPLTVRAFQAAVGSLSCVFALQAAGRLFSWKEGVVAGGLLALYAPAVFFDGILQDSVLDLFLGSLTLWVLVELWLRRSRWLWWALGLSLGLFTLSRENALVLVVPVLLWLWLRYAPGTARTVEETGRRRVRIVATALLALGVLTALAPVAIRNRAVGGQFLPGTYNLGMNLYIGNNPRADGYYHPLRPGRGNPRFEARDVVELAERDVGRELTATEVSAYWTGRALEYVFAEPLDWLGLLGRKAVLGLNDTEVNDTIDLYTVAERSPILRLLRWILSFGVLAPLALLGVWVTWPDRSRLWLFYLLPVFYLASLVAFFVFARYRHPMAPYLALLAAVGLVRLPEFVRGADPKRLGLSAAAVLGLAIVGRLPVGLAPAQLRGTSHANVGAALEERREYRAAARQYGRGLEIDPTNSQANYHLASLLHRAGRLEEALGFYREAVRSDPDRPQIRNNYGVALAMAGRLGEGRRELRRAIELDPAFADARVNLGRTFEVEGDLSTAVEHYRSAVAADPGFLPARLRLGRALLLVGSLEEGYDHLGLAAGPPPGADGPAAQGAPRTRSAAARVPLAAAWELAAAGDPEEREPERARRILAEAPEFVPRNAVYHRTLAAALAGTGRFDEAAATVRRAIAALRDEGASAQEEAGGAEGSAGDGAGAGVPRPTLEELEEELRRYREGRPFPESR